MFLVGLAARSARPVEFTPAVDPSKADAAAPTATPSDSAVHPEAVSTAAFEEFYDATKGALRGYLMAALRNGGLADDMTQEAFIRLLTAKRPFANDEHRRRYLFRIASNLLTDHWRKARHAALPLDEALLGSSSQAAFQESAPDLDARRDLIRELGKLEPRERQLIWLAHVEHLEHREIAAIAGVSRASVRVLLFRARRRLALALSGEGPRRVTKGVAT